MHLRAALQALAASADVQLARFPPFTVAADELALDFVDAILMYRQDGPALTPHQDQQIRALDALLHQMSGSDHVDLWTSGALQTAPEWNTVREHARDTLRAFGWPLEPPPPTDNVYVPGRAT